jgi:hypothetical protein
MMLLMLLLADIIERHRLGIKAKTKGRRVERGKFNCNGIALHSHSSP